jgi:hypothetical protein
MLEVTLCLATTVTFSFIAKRYSKQILRFTAEISKKPYLNKFFKFMATISTSTLKWFVAGKTIEEIGSKIDSKPLKVIGGSIVFSSSFALTHKYKIPLLSKAAQGVLISAKPFQLTYSLATNYTLDSKTYDALFKGSKWGARDFIEIHFNQVTKNPIISKTFSLLVTEQSISTTLKTVTRDFYEKQMLNNWKDHCSDLELQIPYIASNLLYSISLDPLFDLVKDLEKRYTNNDPLIAVNISSNTTSDPAIPGNIAQQSSGEEQ